MMQSFMYKCFGVGFVILLGSQFSFAQQSDASRQYDPNSTLEIPEYEQLYRVRVWRRIDLREKQNKGFFAYNKELPKLILEGAMSGEIDSIYYDFDLKRSITFDEMQTNMTKEDAGEVKPYDAYIAFEYGEFVSYNGRKYMSIQENNSGFAPDENPDMWQEDETAGVAITYENSDIGIIELMEDVIFDKRRSTLYHDIIALKLIIPTDRNELGSAINIATFKYKDLEKYFRNHPNEAKWVNRYNPKEWKNYADAFTLRLFHGPIIKYETPDDLYIHEIMPNQYEAVMEINKFEMDLMEKEHNLWEY